MIGSILSHYLSFMIMSHLGDNGVTFFFFEVVMQ